MPSAGGVRFAVDGREEAAEVKDSVRVMRRAGKLAGAAMLGILKPFDCWRDSSRRWDFENGNFSRLGAKTPR